MPFLSFAAEIRIVIYSTNAIESVNARIRKAAKARSHFPNEAAEQILEKVRRGRVALTT